MLIPNITKYDCFNSEAKIILFVILKENLLKLQQEKIITTIIKKNVSILMLVVFFQCNKNIDKYFHHLHKR